LAMLGVDLTVTDYSELHFSESWDLIVLLMMSGKRRAAKVGVYSGEIQRIFLIQKNFVPLYFVRALDPIRGLIQDLQYKFVRKATRRKGHAYVFDVSCVGDVGRHAFYVVGLSSKQSRAASRIASRMRFRRALGPLLVWYRPLCPATNR
jgi:hypothetical protein